MSGVKVVVKSLKKNFGKRRVLKSVSFNCEAGESVVLLGESGMGKSVLMRIIGMLLEATSGSVVIDGQEVVGITDKNRYSLMKKVGFLFQYSGLFDHLSVWENIMFYELFIQKKDPKEMKSVALKLMNELDIPKVAVDLKPSQISGGMQRRVAMARTIIKRPSLILLDEPTTGLDPVLCNSVNDLINKTKEQTGATMITITHDLNSAIQIGDRILVLRDGEIIWNGKPKDLFNVDNEYIQNYIRSANINKKILLGK